MTDDQGDEKWFARTMTSCSSPRMRLFCFPHGGAGASAFREWQEHAPSDVEIVSVQLPGRETRIAEPAVRSIPEICDALIGPITRRAGSLPFAFLGHSMGSLVAFELSHLMAGDAARPSALTVSGASAPQLPLSEPLVHTLPQEEFIAHAAMLGGIPEELLGSEYWAELMFPVLRADFEACETYRVDDRELLNIPMVILGGADDPVAPPPNVKAWAQLCAAPTTSEIFEGDHFFLFEHAARAISSTVLASRGAAA